jgi:hypothetical protein
MRLWRWAATVTTVALVASCGGRFGGDAGTNGGAAGASPGGRGATSAGGASSGGGVSSTAGTLSLGADVPPCRDSDRDGLNDLLEGFVTNALYSSDDDGDMVPNYLDADSDGDGLEDASEGGVAACASVARDSDGDGLPDFRERDSDGDGLLDALELPNGFSATSPDTDADACPDFQQYAFGDCAGVVVIDYQCFRVVEGELVLEVPEQVEGTLTDLTLGVARVDDSLPSDLQVRALSIAPPESGTIDSAARLTSVSAGAKVTFVVNPNQNEDWYAYLVTIESASFGRVASARVIVTGSDPCPIPK